MSVTISIQNNRSYVDENCPDRISYTTFKCECDMSTGNPDPDCWECHGKGEITFSDYPFEMNLANANFHTLFSALGLSTDYCGTVAPQAVLKALNRTPLALIVREDREEPIGIVDCLRKKAKNEGCEVVYFGISLDRAQSYQTRLAAIALEAERREESVTWG